MKLLKVGESYLNLHNVAMFRDDGEVVTACFHTEMSPISFEGEDGHNLRS